jgi:hypothetical protein
MEMNVFIQTGTTLFLIPRLIDANIVANIRLDKVAHRRWSCVHTYLFENISIGNGHSTYRQIHLQHSPDPTRQFRPDTIDQCRCALLPMVHPNHPDDDQH